MTRPNSPFASPNPLRLHRDTVRGKVAGVCAGIGDYFGIDPNLVRIAVVVAFFMFPPATVIAYVVAALILKPAPQRPALPRDEEEFWRTVNTHPDRTVAGLRSRFRDLERRLASVEGCVASKEFELNRAINDLDK